jgi:VIT1/CCC1 family predicted Fe2+/Mn2+ transporter
MPLLPYAPGTSEDLRFLLSGAVTLATLFAVGASRAAITTVRWWTGGLEMLLLGIGVAAAAYGSGALAAWLLGAAS